MRKVNAMADLVPQVNNILFLDLSTSSTGWAIADINGNLKAYGCIAPPKSKDVLDRITMICGQIQDLVIHNNIVKIVAEEVHDDIPNSHVYKVLTWLQGIVQYVIHGIAPQVTFEFLQASTWRKHIGIATGRGIKRETLKKKDIEYVNNKYQIGNINDDIADAICLKDAYFNIQQFNWA